MLIIKATESSETQKQYCAACGAEYRDGTLCYAAYDGTPEDDASLKLLGICQFDLGAVGMIYDLCNTEGVDDEEALFIMGRQTLNFIALCGTHDAFLSEDIRISEHLRKWIGFFKKKDNLYYMDLRGFFEEPCKHTPSEKE